MKKKIFFKSIIGIAIVGTFVLAGTLGWAQDATSDFYFYRLGHMTGPHDLSKSLGISRDGKVAVGECKVVDFMHAWRVDIDAFLALYPIPPINPEDRRMEDLGTVAPGSPSGAYAASNMTYSPTSYDLLNPDWGGSLPVGYQAVGNVPYAGQWLPVFTNVEGVMVPSFLGVPDFGGGLTDIKAKDVSADGFIYVGTGNNKRGQLGFRCDTRVLDATTGVPVVVTLTIIDSETAQKLPSSAAEAVTPDGNTIVGYGTTPNGNRAFITTGDFTDPAAPVLVSSILPMIGGGKFAEAYAVTPDGAVIAGRSDSSKGPQACIWYKDSTTGAWVVRALGGLANTIKKINSAATSIAYRTGSTDGELIVVGRSQSVLYSSEAFVWSGSLADTTVGYLYDLEYILTKTGAAAASLFGSEWVLYEATGISDDGTRIVGWGTNPEGGYEAWAVTGYPLTLVLTGE